MHAALACETERVECGCLVYSIGYRHPAVLAKAITAIDLLSGGRAAMGIGAGWAEVEYDAYGIDFPSIGTRMDQLEEGVAILRGLLHDEETTFEGTWFSVRNARNEPRPVQDKLPIWVGGGGEKRTLRIAARFADGWNVPFVDPATFAAKRDVLHAPLRRRRPRPGRDPLRRQRRSGLDRGEPAPAVRPARAPRARPACSAARCRRSSTASASTSTPAPIRSTWPCGRRSTSTPSSSSARRWHCRPDPPQGRRGADAPPEQVLAVDAFDGDAGERPPQLVDVGGGERVRLAGHEHDVGRLDGGQLDRRVALGRRPPSRARSRRGRATTPRRCRR